MAAALAKRWWPKCRISSVGTKSITGGHGAADEAVAVMRRLGLDISRHRTAPISAVDAETFQFIVALDKGVRRTLIEVHSIPESKIKNLFVDDPYYNTEAQYEKCANEIAKRLGSIKFSN